MTIIRTTDGLEIQRATAGSDFELEIIDGEEHRTYYVKDRESLTEILESAAVKLESGITYENWK